MLPEVVRGLFLSQVFINGSFFKDTGAIDIALKALPIVLRKETAKVRRVDIKEFCGCRLLWFSWLKFLRSSISANTKILQVDCTIQGVTMRQKEYVFIKMIDIP